MKEACDLHRQVLEARVRVLGLTHPHTSVAASNLWHALTDLNEVKAGLEVVRDYLVWLLKVDPNQLGEQQRRIRQSVLDLFRRT
jgi:hypothetical protein